MKVLSRPTEEGPGTLISSIMTILSECELEGPRSQCKYRGINANRHRFFFSVDTWSLEPAAMENSRLGITARRWYFLHKFGVELTSYPIVGMISMIVMSPDTNIDILFIRFYIFQFLVLQYLYTSPRSSRH
jgi:hypothetical protein